MSWYYDDYEDPRAARARVLLEISKRRRKGEPFVAEAPATPRGKIAATFWGQAWCDNLESYADYEHRLPRGRSYLRNGSVFDLEVSEGYVFAYAAGTSLYEVEIEIDPMEPRRWKKLRNSIAGGIDNIVALLGGDLGEPVMAAVTDPGAGLFPAPDEIHISCSCPDWATLCKHAAATLYAVGVRFDRDPKLFFKLRGVDPDELIGAAAKGVANLTTPAAGISGHDVLAPGDLAELFGIDLAEPESAFPDTTSSRP